MANEPKKSAAPKKADNKTPRERFTTVGANRVGKVIKALRNLHNISSPKSYEYSDSDVSKMFAAIDAEVAGVKDKFAKAKQGGSTKAEAGFTFG